jgi:hypothetical protein
MWRAIEWPSRLPGLNPMDSFLWGHPEEDVCAVFPRTMNDLAASLQAAVTTVDANVQY